MALEIIRRGISLMPIGLTPGHLSSGMRRQATNALRPSGFTIDVQSLCPTAARAEQRSFEEDLKEEHNLRQANASNPDSPAAPLVLSAAFSIRLALRPSKMMGLGVWWFPGNSTTGGGGVLAGCLSVRTSRTERSSPLIPILILSSRFITPLVLLVVRIFKADWTLPFFIFSANLKAWDGFCVVEEWFDLSRSWIHFPSLRKASRSPENQRSRRLSRCFE